MRWGRRQRPRPKAQQLEKELQSDGFMMLAFGVAKELRMTLAALFECMTFDELLGWSAYFAVIRKIEKEQADKARRLR
jgi:hypothetical protein